MFKPRALMLAAVAVLVTIFLSAGATALAAYHPQVVQDPGTPEATEAPEGPEADDAAGQNAGKVVAALAAAFGVSPEEIRARQAAGLGYGEIYRAYSLATASGQSVDAVLAARAAGKGWGELYAAAGLKVGGGLGALVGNGHGKDRAQPHGKPGKPGKHGPAVPIP